MSSSFCETFLGQVVVQPEHGKWTKTTQTLDFLVSAICCCDMLRRLLRVSGRKLELETSTGSATQKLHFAKKDGGSLWRSVVSLTDDRDCKASWIIMALVLERVRAITRFFLKTSTDTFQGTAGCSLAVFDCCNEHFSVVVETMQYTRSSKVQEVDS